MTMYICLPSIVAMETVGDEGERHMAQAIGQFNPATFTWYRLGVRCCGVCQDKSAAFRVFQVLKNNTIQSITFVKVAMETQRDIALQRENFND